MGEIPRPFDLERFEEEVDCPCGLYPDGTCNLCLEAKREKALRSSHAADSTPTPEKPDRRSGAKPSRAEGLRHSGGSRARKRASPPNTPGSTWRQDKERYEREFGRPQNYLADDPAWKAFKDKFEDGNKK